MAKTREQKAETLSSLREKFRDAKALVFANFAGLKAKDIEELRAKVRQSGMYYTVAKKTLMKKAGEDAGITGFQPKILPGSVGVLACPDEVSGAKLLDVFRKDHDALKILGGILEKKFIDAVRVLELAKLPGRSELLARLAGSLNAPISGLVNVLSGNLRGLVNVLNAIKDKKV